MSTSSKAIHPTSWQKRNQASGGRTSTSSAGSGFSVEVSIPEYEHEHADGEGEGYEERTTVCYTYAKVNTSAV
jgi:hypothetical protein